MSDVLGVVSCILTFSFSLGLLVFISTPLVGILGSWSGDANSRAAENIRTAISMVIIIWLSIASATVPIVITWLVGLLFWQ